MGYTGRLLLDGVTLGLAAYKRVWRFVDSVF